MRVQSDAENGLLVGVLQNGGRAGFRLGGRARLLVGTMCGAYQVLAHVVVAEGPDPR